MGRCFIEITIIFLLSVISFIVVTSIINYRIINYRRSHFRTCPTNNARKCITLTNVVRWKLKYTSRERSNLPIVKFLYIFSVRSYGLFRNICHGLLRDILFLHFIWACNIVSSVNDKNQVSSHFGKFLLFKVVLTSSCWYRAGSHLARYKIDLARSIRGRNFAHGVKFFIVCAE